MFLSLRHFRTLLPFTCSDDSCLSLSCTRAVFPTLLNFAENSLLGEDSSGCLHSCSCSSLFLTWLCASRLAGTPRLSVWWSLLALSLVLHDCFHESILLASALSSLELYSARGFTTLMWTESALVSELCRAPTNSVELRFGFVHLRAKDLIACTFWIMGTCLCMISGVSLFPELCLMNLRDR